METWGPRQLPNPDPLDLVSRKEGSRVEWVSLGHRRTDQDSIRTCPWQFLSPSRLHPLSWNLSDISPVGVRGGPSIHFSWVCASQSTSQLHLEKNFRP